MVAFFSIIVFSLVGNRRIMKKIIIGIHGLGNKPPEDLLERWWKQAIFDGLNDCNLQVQDFDFDLVYWADVLHSQPLDPEEQNKKNRFYLPGKYISEHYPVSYGPMNIGKKAIEYLGERYEKIWMEGILPLNKPSLTGFFVHFHFRDMETYYAPELINYKGEKRPAKDCITGQFFQKLQKYRDRDILLIAHSMGSNIAFDTLMDYPTELKIDTFVTVGSPLGQKYFINKILETQKDNTGYELRVPGNITKNWYNLSDTGDQVVQNHGLEEIYAESSRKVKVTDKQVHNYYSNSGTNNPHNSFGYLRTPEMAEIIYSFLSYHKPGLFTRIWKKMKKAE